MLLLELIRTKEKNQAKYSEVIHNGSIDKISNHLGKKLILYGTYASTSNKLLE